MEATPLSTADILKIVKFTKSKDPLEEGTESGLYPDTPGFDYEFQEPVWTKIIQGSSIHSALLKNDPGPGVPKSRLYRIQEMTRQFHGKTGNPMDNYHTYRVCLSALGTKCAGHFYFSPDWPVTKCSQVKPFLGPKPTDDPKTQNLPQNDPSKWLSFVPGSWPAPSPDKATSWRIKILETYGTSSSFTQGDLRMSELSFLDVQGRRVTKAPPRINLKESHPYGRCGWEKSCWNDGILSNGNAQVSPSAWYEGAKVRIGGPIIATYEGLSAPPAQLRFHSDRREGEPALMNVEYQSPSISSSSDDQRFGATNWVKFATVSRKYTCECRERNDNDMSFPTCICPLQKIPTSNTLMCKDDVAASTYYTGNDNTAVVMDGWAAKCMRALPAIRVGKAAAQPVLADGTVKCHPLTDEECWKAAVDACDTNSKCEAIRYRYISKGQPNEKWYRLYSNCAGRVVKTCRDESSCMKTIKRCFFEETATYRGYVKRSMLAASWQKLFAGNPAV